MSALRFGLDFGTSNSAVAVSDGGRVRLLRIDPIAGETMPSVLYIRRDGSALIGQPAIDGFLADNRARGPFRREFKMLGIRMPSSDPEQPTVEAHIFTDTSSPGRLFQSLKTFLGDPLLVATNVFGDAHRLEDLVALVLAGIFRRVEELTGTRPLTATIGRPVEFVGGPDVEERARTRLEQAARLAGLREVRFVQEPVAAAFAADVPAGLALVFDFGGGTLDLCVTRREAGEIRVLATAGADVAGDRFTQLLIDRLARRIWAPSSDGDRKGSSSHASSRPRSATGARSPRSARNRSSTRSMTSSASARRSASSRALRSAIELQLGYEIFASVDATKRVLSSEQLALFSFHRGAVDIDQQASRHAFELAIAPLMRRVEASLDDVLARAGVQPEQIVEIVCTGGSSAIPAARALVRRRFSGAALRDLSAHTTVAAGLALAS